MKFVMLFLLAADQAPKPPQAPPEAKAEKPHVSPKVEAKTLRHTPTPIIRRVRSGNC